MSIAAVLGVVVHLRLVAILGDHYIFLPGYDGDVADDHSDSRLNNNDLSDNIDDSSSVFSYRTEDSP